METIQVEKTNQEPNALLNSSSLSNMWCFDLWKETESRQREQLYQSYLDEVAFLKREF